MKWEKLGLIYSPKSMHKKLLTHASNPLAIQLDENLFRIYFSSRDEQKRSSVGAIDFDISSKEIRSCGNEPFLIHGEVNSFFSEGISLGNACSIDGEKYIFFMGWQNKIGSHWHGFIGKLRVTKDFKLEMPDASPIFGFDAVDKISYSYPFVYSSPEHKFIMCYGSTSHWDAGNGEMLHILKFAISEDGRCWEKIEKSVPHQIGVAQAFSKPSVVRLNDGTFHMWFSYRGSALQKYRIGYAKSKNGIDWVLDIENAGITVSQTGWDSEMIEYPFVFRHNENLYMLYNGNAYGASGFGLARSNFLCN